MALQSFSCMLLVVGLNRAFSSGVIYCSPITATLLTKDMGMPAERVIPLLVDTPIVIDGVSVTLMDANHCPGACMMLFKVPSKTGKPQVRLPSLCLLHLWLPGCLCILCYSRNSKAYRPYTCMYTYIHTYAYIHTHVHIYIRTYIHTYVVSCYLVPVFLYVNPGCGVMSAHTTDNVHAIHILSPVRARTACGSCFWLRGYRHAL